MKYRIVNPHRFHYHPVYLIGHDPEGKPKYRFNSTNPPSSKAMSPSARALFASMLTQLSI